MFSLEGEKIGELIEQLGKAVDIGEAGDWGIIVVEFSGGKAAFSA